MFISKLDIEAYLSGKRDRSFQISKKFHDSKYTIWDGIDERMMFFVGRASFKSIFKYNKGDIHKDSFFEAQVLREYANTFGLYVVNSLTGHNHTESGSILDINPGIIFTLYKIFVEKLPFEGVLGVKRELDKLGGFYTETENSLDKNIPPNLKVKALSQRKERNKAYTQLNLVSKITHENANQFLKDELSIDFVLRQNNVPLSYDGDLIHIGTPIHQNLDMINRYYFKDEWKKWYLDIEKSYNSRSRFKEILTGNQIFSDLISFHIAMQYFDKHGDGNIDKKIAFSQWALKKISGHLIEPAPVYNNDSIKTFRYFQTINMYMKNKSPIEVINNLNKIKN